MAECTKGLQPLEMGAGKFSINLNKGLAYIWVTGSVGSANSRDLYSRVS